MLMLVLSIIFFVVYHQRRMMAIQNEKEKDLTEAAITAEENERNRIASELHDDVGAMLASVKLNFHQAEEDGPGSNAFTQSHHLIEETIDKVRKMSRSLQPSMMQHLGLVSTLRGFFDMFANNNEIAIHYEATPIPKLEDNTALGIYRIIQELVNNTLKHANATEITLKHYVADNYLIFRYTHNGQGITHESFNTYIYKKDATGLKNIVNRLKVINATISFSYNETHYHTIIQIPLDNQL
jgi:two-component system, NarL family, sensor kinase